jgi:hypothetical protein
MDPDPRILGSCFIPYVAFFWHDYLLGMPDGNVVAILAGKFHSLSKVAFIINFTLLQVEL